MELGACLDAVRQRRPLVQCITNVVTVNDCANILLASGGSPTMASHILEVEEAVEGVQALVCNMGAIDKTESMLRAGKRANALGIPVILDPVGAGGTKLRRETAKRLLEEVHFTVIRGNASEIRYLSGENTMGSGVDVCSADEITEENLTQAIKMARALARKTGSVIAISGKLDVICDGRRTLTLRNGCATMSRVTGTGCMLTALMGAFCGSCSDAFTAACSASAAMGIAGEIAEDQRLRKGTGNATFRTDLIDAIFNLTEEQLIQGVNYEIYE